MKKSRLKKSHSKSKLSWIIAGLAFFLVGSIYLVIASGTGPLSFLASPSDINKVVDCKGDDDCIEANAIAKKQGLKGAQYNQAVQQVTQTLKKDNEYVEKRTVNKPMQSQDDDPAEDVPATQQVVAPQPIAPCPADQQIVITSEGNKCVPTNGDSIACGVYAYSQNNKCYPIGYKEGDMELCDWTVRDTGRHYAFFSNDCPKVSDNNLGMPKNSDECSTSKEFPGWWSPAENKCIQVGESIVKSDLIVCAAKNNTKYPEANYPTLSTTLDCKSYTATIVTPPVPAVPSNEVLDLRQEECKTSSQGKQKYDVATGVCIDLVKCTPVPPKMGAKSYTTCGSDGKIELKLCNNPAGFDANGLCPTTPTVIPPAPVTDPKEPKTVIAPPVTTSGYIDNIGCSRRYQTTCKEADDGKWYPIVPPVNISATTPINPIDDRPATPQEEARTKTYDSYLGCSTKTGGLCKVDPDDPKKYVSISYIDPTPSKPTSITPVNPVDNKPATPQEEARTKIYNTYSDCSTKTSGLCKPDPNDPKKYVSISYVDPTDTTANPILVSPPQEPSSEEIAKPSAWSQIVQFFAVSKNKAPTPQEEARLKSYNSYADCSTQTVGLCKADPNDPNKFVSNVYVAPKEEITKPSLWSQVVEYFSDLFPVKNATPPQGYLDNPSCETRYQADCIEDADGMWYPQFSK